MQALPCRMVRIQIHEQSTWRATGISSVFRQFRSNVTNSWRHSLHSIFHLGMTHSRSWINVLKVKGDRHAFHLPSICDDNVNNITISRIITVWIINVKVNHTSLLSVPYHLYVIGSVLQRRWSFCRAGSVNTGCSWHGEEGAKAASGPQSGR